MKTLALFLTLFGFGCQAPAPEPMPAPIFHSPLGVVTLDVQGPPALMDSVKEAIAFWAGHGLSFDVVAGGAVPVTVGETPPGTLGIYTFDGRLIMQPTAVGYAGASCTVAHELGHSVGMMHVAKTQALMAEIASIHEGGACFWTDLDVAEEMRVLQLER